ncbi:TerC family protein [Puia dinghuensis]|uniref:Membrane protein n=1 Tax=Puia dinghuensis TaxID=1792502 RepID=A0A8J2UEE6_9BACT|nr:TerC family protein [Puia dinghuensis]GGB06550.1 membrane protein [Puia dinghuensis]
MHSLFTLDSLISLFTLCLLEIVLGIDNVIFVSLIIGRLPAPQQLNARRVWMIAGILIRSGLLMGLGWLVTHGNKVLFSIAGYGFSTRHLIMMAGGLFLLFKTVQEIHEKLEGGGEGEAGVSERSGQSFLAIVTQLVLVDTVFSFDSIITAVGLAQQVTVMITAVILAMIIMFFFSQGIANFINRRPTVKILALSFLLMVGFSLLFEGLEPIHHSHIDKGYIYFSMVFAFGVELLNTRARKKKH